MIRIHFLVPEQQRKALERLSKRTGLKVSELLRRAIALLLKEEAEREAS